MKIRFKVTPRGNLKSRKNIFQKWSVIVVYNEVCDFLLANNVKEVYISDKHRENYEHCTLQDSTSVPVYIVQNKITLPFCSGMLENIFGHVPLVIYYKLIKHG